MTRKSRKTLVTLLLVGLGAAFAWWLWRRYKARRASEATPQPTATPTPRAPTQEPTSPEPAPTAVPDIDMSDEPEIIPRSPSAPAPSPTTKRPKDLDLWIDDEAEALARVIASEAGRQGRETQTRIAWTARNRARYKKTTIARLVCQPCGRQVGNRRPFSSWLAPNDQHRAIAAEVLAQPQTADPTGGADHILEPSLMDRQYAAGTARKNAAMVRADRLRSLDYYGSFGGWDFFGPRGGSGARPAPPEWNLGQLAA